MASSIENVKLGVCTVLYNAVDLGYTKGGVSVSVTTNKYTKTVDQFGDTPIGDVITGRMVTATVPLAETTLTNLVAVMPGAYLNVAADRVDVVPAVGTDLITTAKTLILRPQAMGALTDEDFVIHKAATAGGLEFTYDNQAERVFNVEFNGYPDSTQDDILFSFGDSTATQAVIP
jgi:hypothetical protein